MIQDSPRSWVNSFPDGFTRPGSLGQVFDHFVHGFGNYVAAADAGQVTLDQLTMLPLEIGLPLQTGPDLVAENAAGSRRVVAVQYADFFGIGAKFAELPAPGTGETA